MRCEEVYNERYDLVIDLDITSPLRTTKDLDNCLKIFLEKKPDVLFSVVPARRSPYFNMVELNAKGFAEVSKKPAKTILRRQDAPSVYDMNASIYFYSRSFLLNESVNYVLSTDKAAIYVMKDESSIDIDNELDFKYVEFLIKEKVIKL